MIRLAILWCMAAVAASAQVTLSTVQNGAVSPAPPIFDFGSVSLGSTATAVFRLTNTGSTPVDLTTVALQGPLSSTPPYAPYFSVVCAQSPDLCSAAPAPLLPIQINPTGTLDFTVQFEPFQAGSPSAAMTIVAGNTMSLILSGTGVPGFTLLWNNQPLSAGETVAFGEVQVGSSQTIALLFTNPGATALNVPAIAPLPSGPFSLSGPALGQPSVASGSFAELDVTFTPSAAGSQQATLTAGLLSYTLEGAGVLPPPTNFPVPSIQLSSSTLGSAQQGSLTINLASASPAAGTGTIAMTFTPSVAATGDPAVAFSDGARSASFTVAEGATIAQFAGGPSLSFGTGTTAGTITFTVTLGSNTAQTAITVAPALIGIDSANAVRDAACDPAIVYCTTTNVQLQVNGWDNTRTLSALSFTFYGPSGAAIAPGAISVDAGSAFESYFAGSNLGGVFGLTAFFPITGDSNQVVAAMVELTNSTGATQSSKITF